MAGSADRRGVYVPAALAPTIAELLRLAVFAKLTNERITGGRPYLVGPVLALIDQLEHCSDPTADRGSENSLGRWVTVDDASKTLGIKHRAVRDRCKNGQLVAIKNAGVWLIDLNHRRW